MLICNRFFLISFCRITTTNLWKTVISFQFSQKWKNDSHRGLYMIEHLQASSQGIYSNMFPVRPSRHDDDGSSVQIWDELIRSRASGGRGYSSLQKLKVFNFFPTEAVDFPFFLSLFTGNFLENTLLHLRPNTKSFARLLELIFNFKNFSVWIGHV
jgi:hypothetical protein